MPTSRKLTTRALACVLTSSAFLAACETIPWRRGETTESALSEVTTATACRSFRRIDPSKRDTDGTLLQVHQHNAAWEALCGSGGN